MSTYSRRFLTVMDRFWSFVEKTDHCWLWKGGAGKSGYGGFWVDGKTVSAHSFILEETAARTGPMALHGCDNKLCVRPSHLYWGTGKQNAKDRLNRYRQPVGSQCSHSKLTEEQVTEIRKDERADGVIAMSYGVSRRMVCQIQLGKVWKHI